MKTASHPLSYKLRPNERELLRAAALAAGMGPSSFAAEAVRKALGTVRRRSLPRPPSAIVDAVRDCTGQLGRLGNNVNQAARAMNAGIPGDADALAAIRADLAAIDAKLGLALKA